MAKQWVEALEIDWAKLAQNVVSFVTSGIEMSLIPPLWQWAKSER